eukprot:XP_022269600.1 uncharacterized protein LOC111093741 [Canis lupus familiaris]
MLLNGDQEGIKPPGETSPALPAVLVLFPSFRPQPRILTASTDSAVPTSAREVWSRRLAPGVRVLGHLWDAFSGFPGAARKPGLGRECASPPRDCGREARPGPGASSPPARGPRSTTSAPQARSRLQRPLAAARRALAARPLPLPLPLPSPPAEPRLRPWPPHFPAPSPSRPLARAPGSESVAQSSRAAPPRSQPLAVTTPGSQQPRAPPHSPLAGGAPRPAPRVLPGRGAGTRTPRPLTCGARSPGASPGRSPRGAAARTRGVEEVAGRRPGKAAGGRARRKSRPPPAPLSIRPRRFPENRDP